MPFPAFDTQASFTWHPTRRTHLLHAAIALFLACIWPILGGTETLSVLAVNIAAAATVPLTSRYPAIGATISLILCWIALAIPDPVGIIAPSIPSGIAAMLLARNHPRGMAYFLPAISIFLHALYNSTHLLSALIWPVVVVPPCLVAGEIVRHHRLQANVAEQERRRKLDQQRRLVVSELHDTVVRDLSHAVMIAEQARLADPHNTRLNQELGAIITPVRTAVEQLRRSLKAMSAAEGDDSLLLLAASPPPPLTDTIRTAREALTHRDAHLTTQGTDLLDNPNIGPGVRQQLVRIIAELINNAAKYTPPSSTATLTIETDNDTLECMCTNPIAPNQPTNTTTSSQLGLTQAQQRIESLGGSLHITHTNDRWTAIFTIPLQPISPMPTD